MRIFTTLYFAVLVIYVGTEAFHEYHEAVHYFVSCRSEFYLSTEVETGFVIEQNEIHVPIPSQ